MAAPLTTVEGRTGVGDILGKANETKGGKRRLIQTILAATTGIVVNQTIAKELGMQVEQLKEVANKVQEKEEYELDEIADLIAKWKAAIVNDPKGGGYVRNKILTTNELIEWDVNGEERRVEIKGSREIEKWQTVHIYRIVEAGKRIHVPIIALPKGMDFSPRAE